MFCQWIPELAYSESYSPSWQSCLIVFFIYMAQVYSFVPKYGKEFKKSYSLMQHKQSCTSMQEKREQDKPWEHWQKKEILQTFQIYQIIIIKHYKPLPSCKKITKSLDFCQLLVIFSPSHQNLSKSSDICLLSTLAIKKNVTYLQTSVKSVYCQLYFLSN